jgi:hypothetical protein
MKRRGHALTIDGGWREVAETALAFVERPNDRLSIAWPRQLALRSPRFDAVSRLTLTRIRSSDTAPR